MRNATEVKFKKYLGRKSQLIPYIFPMCADGNVRYEVDKRFEGPPNYVDDIGFYIGGCAVENGDTVVFYPNVDGSDTKSSIFRVKFDHDGLLEKGSVDLQSDLLHQREMKALMSEVELDGCITEYDLQHDIGWEFYNLTTEQPYSPLVYRRKVGFFIGRDTVEKGDILVKKPLGKNAKRNPKIFEVMFINRGLIPSETRR